MAGFWRRLFGLGGGTRTESAGGDVSASGSTFEAQACAEELRGLGRELAQEVFACAERKEGESSDAWRSTGLAEALCRLDATVAIRAGARITTDDTRASEALDVVEAGLPMASAVDASPALEALEHLPEGERRGRAAASLAWLVPPGSPGRRELLAAARRALDAMPEGRARGRASVRLRCAAARGGAEDLAALVGLDGLAALPSSPSPVDVVCVHAHAAALFVDDTDARRGQVEQARNALDGMGSHAVKEASSDLQEALLDLGEIDPEETLDRASRWGFADGEVRALVEAVGGRAPRAGARWLSSAMAEARRQPMPGMKAMSLWSILKAATAVDARAARRLLPEIRQHRATNKALRPAFGALGDLGQILGAVDSLLDTVSMGFMWDLMAVDPILRAIAPASPDEAVAFVEGEDLEPEQLGSAYLAIAGIVALGHPKHAERLVAKAWKAFGVPKPKRQRGAGTDDWDLDDDPLPPDPERHLPEVVATACIVSPALADTYLAKASDPAMRRRCVVEAAAQRARALGPDATGWVRAGLAEALAAPDEDARVEALDRLARGLDEGLRRAGRREARSAFARGAGEAPDAWARRLATQEPGGLGPARRRAWGDAVCDALEAFRVTAGAPPERESLVAIQSRWRSSRDARPNLSDVVSGTAGFGQVVARARDAGSATEAACLPPLADALRSSIAPAPPLSAG